MQNVPAGMTIHVADFLREITVGIAFGIILSIVLSIVLMIKFFKRNGNGNGNSPHPPTDRRGDPDGITVIDYLRTEIKPDIEQLQRDHVRLQTVVAALPTREEFQSQITEVHSRIDNHLIKEKKDAKSTRSKTS